MENYIYGERGEGSRMLAAKLLSPIDIGAPLREAAGIAEGLYAGIVAKRSGALAESTQVGPLFIGGEKFDRLEIEITSGAGLPRGGYGAAHEYGIGIHPRSPEFNAWMVLQPADDWVKVLAIMSSMSGARVRLPRGAYLAPGKRVQRESARSARRLQELAVPTREDQARRARGKQFQRSRTPRAARGILDAFPLPKLPKPLP